MSDDLSKVEAVTLTADQAAMLRKVLAAIGGCVGTTIGHKTFFVPAQVVQDARDALALMPEPVDADLVEAREICAEASIRAGQPQQAEEYRAGKWDAGYTIDVAKIALRRALERDSREG